MDSDWRWLEESLWRAETRFDPAYLDQLLAPEFREVGRSGVSYDRRAVLAVEPRPIDVRLPLPELTVRQLGDDVVLVTYRTETTAGGTPAHRVSVWVRDGGRWRLRFHQATPAAPEVTPRSVAGVSVQPHRQDPVAVERLLRSLPSWFGVESSLRQYVLDAAQLPSYLAAAADGDVVGALLVKRHTAHSAEIHLMAVDPGRHRQGVGRALLTAAEADLVADGVRFLQVKTRGPSRPDPGYEKTRAFYSACGFTPLEEILDLWDEENPCLIMVKTLP